MKLYNIIYIYIFNNSLEKEVHLLKNKNAEKDSCIQSLEGRINRLKQYSRKDSIEIREVPVVEGESVEKIVVQLAKKLDVEQAPSYFERFFLSRNKGAVL